MTQRVTGLETVYLSGRSNNEATVTGQQLVYITGRSADRMQANGLEILVIHVTPGNLTPAVKPRRVTSVCIV